MILSRDAAKSPRVHGVLIALAPLVFLVGSFASGFQFYDDPQHTFRHPQYDATILDLFAKPAEESSYFPVTLLSYRLERYVIGAIFQSLWGFPDWAQAARFMNVVYHAGAALVLWRILAALKFTPGQSLFGALLFSLHPTSAESAAWISERKNVLAALFGFSAILVFLLEDRRWWRVPLSSLLYALASMSKPSALGLLPIFPIIELAGGLQSITASGPLKCKGPRDWLRATLLSLPMAALALFSLHMNLQGHKYTIVAPPGGTVFAAMLTDSEVFARYLFNLALPVNLSFFYLVEPIVSLADTRLWLYGAAIVIVVGGTLYCSAHRRRTLFGWLWFFAALGPNMNLVGLSYIMQDRYLYLSLPGFCIVVAEMAATLREKINRRREARGFDILHAAALAIVAAFAALSVQRGYLFGSFPALMADAAMKQPRSAMANHMLLLALSARVDREPDPARRERMIEEVRKLHQAFLQAPDAKRTLHYYSDIFEFAQALFNLKRYDESEAKYLTLLEPNELIHPKPEMLGWTYRDLARIRLARNDSAKAQEYIQEAEAHLPHDDKIMLVKGQIQLAMSEEKQATDAAEAARLREQAIQTLKSIPESSSVYKLAQNALNGQ